jgi:hypothetical protein
MPDMKSLERAPAETYALAAVNRLKVNLPEGWKVRKAEDIGGLKMKESACVLTRAGSKATLIVTGDARSHGGSWSYRKYKAVISIVLGDEQGIRMHAGRRAPARRYDVTSPEGEFNTKGFWRAAEDLMVSAVKLTAERDAANKRMQEHKRIGAALSKALGFKVEVAPGWYGSEKLRATLEGSQEELTALAARLQGNG